MMMSYDKRPSHTRLPSFNELTSNFTSTLKITGTNQKETTHTVPPSSLTANPAPHSTSRLSHRQSFPQSHNFDSHSQPVTPSSSQSLGSATEGFQPAPASASSQAPPELLNFRFPPQQTQVPPQFQHHLNRQSANFEAVAPKMFFNESEPNYVISSQNPNFHRQAPSQLFEHSRRLSLQYPPSSRTHVKSDSMESQGSLHTLANIASYTPNHQGLHTLLGELEQTLLGFEKLHQIVVDMNTDFLNHLKASANSNTDPGDVTNTGGSQESRKFHLSYDYKTSDGAYNELRADYFERFLGNIPVAALNESIKITSEMNQFFQHWLIQKEREIHLSSYSHEQHPQHQHHHQQQQQHHQQQQQQKQQQQHRHHHHQQEYQREQQREQQEQQQQQQQQQKPHQAHLRHMHQPSSTSSSTGRSKRGASFSPPATHVHGTRAHHRANSSVVPTQQSDPVAEGSSTSSSPTKRRKPSRDTNTLASTKADNVSLVVKPPKPQTQPSSGQASKGTFQEELSVKQDHKCHQCGSDDTPEWRKGPYGSRSLCNACGLFYGKLGKKYGLEKAASIMIERRDSGAGDDRRIPLE